MGKAGNPRPKRDQKIQDPRHEARHQLLRRKAGNQRPKKGQNYSTVWHRK